MAGSKIWGEVNKLLAEGKIPSVMVSRAARLVKDTGPKRRGPPIKRIDGKKYKHWAMHSPGGDYRLRCRLYGCSKEINSKRNSLCCCDGHEEQLREIVAIYHEILQGKMPASDLPLSLRRLKLGRLTKEEVANGGRQRPTQNDERPKHESPRTLRIIWRGSAAA